MTEWKTLLLLDTHAAGFYTGGVIYLTEYIIGLQIVTSLLMAWFMSGLPTHVLSAAGRLLPAVERHYLTALRLSDPNLSVLEAMNIVVADSSSVVRLLVELLSCRICLSFHVSFWVSLAMWLCNDLPILFIPAATLSWPYLANLLLTKLTNHDH